LRRVWVEGGAFYKERDSGIIGREETESLVYAMGDAILTQRKDEQRVNQNRKFL
jgi:hypothetical protein